MLAVVVVIATAIAVAIMVPSMPIVESISVIVVSVPIRAASIVISIVETVAIIVAARSVVVVIPGTGTDKHAVHKPVRTVVAVRSACIRSIPIITVSTDRSWPHIAIRRANANVDDNSLRMRIGSEKQANAQETQKP